MKLIYRYTVALLIFISLSCTSIADHYTVTNDQKWESIDTSLVLISNETNMKKRLKKKFDKKKPFEKFKNPEAPEAVPD